MARVGDGLSTHNIRRQVRSPSIANASSDRTPRASVTLIFPAREVASTLGISCVTANGPIGQIEGNLNDWTIFWRYVHGQVWENNTSRICIDYFNRYGQGTFIDVGANIGMIFIPVVQKSGSLGLAIEASPTTFAHLATNCARNLAKDAYKLHYLLLATRRE